jgi:hypothetical protein
MGAARGSCPARIFKDKLKKCGETKNSKPSAMVEPLARHCLSIPTEGTGLIARGNPLSFFKGMPCSAAKPARRKTRAKLKNRNRNKRS